jgi:glutamate 5-kinase
MQAAHALRTDWLDSLASDIARMQARARHGCDRRLVGLDRAGACGPVVGTAGATVLPLDEAQAAAAVGQIRLARKLINRHLAPHGTKTAQILLTLDDSGDQPALSEYARATLGALSGALALCPS